MGSEMRNINANLSSAYAIKGGDIPELVLSEVLVRLPVKALFKFKIVSKQWFCMICDSSFVRMYVARASLLPHSQNWTLISPYACEATIEQFFAKNLSSSGCSLGINGLDMSNLPDTEDMYGIDYIILGISNGLVLYGHRDEVGIYYICNPITGQRITLPQHKHRLKPLIRGFVTQVEDNVLLSLRVVCLESECNFCRAEVYFSETSEWLYLNIDFNQPVHLSWWKNTVVDKILYFLTMDRRMMVYDPYNTPRSGRLISLPSVANVSSERNKVEIQDILPGEHQRHLRYIELSCYGGADQEHRCLSIWVLNDYKSGEWCLQHRVSISDIKCDDLVTNFSRSVTFHPFDPSIVYMMNNKKLFSYNMKTRKLECKGFLRKVDSFEYLWSFFLFVIPPWPVSIYPLSFKFAD